MTGKNRRGAIWKLIVFLILALWYTALMLREFWPDIFYLA